MRILTAICSTTQRDPWPGKILPAATAGPFLRNNAPMLIAKFERDHGHESKLGDTIIVTLRHLRHSGPQRDLNVSIRWIGKVGEGNIIIRGIFSWSKEGGVGFTPSSMPHAVRRQPEEWLNQLQSALCHALDGIFGASDLGSAQKGILVDPQYAAQHVVQAVIADREKAKIQKNDRQDLLAAHKNRLDRLPDGVPLQVLAYTRGGRWSLGFKNGPIPSALAARIRPLPQDALTPEVIAKVGLSAHNVLSLKSGQALLAQHDPDFTEFADPLIRRPTMTLCPQRPISADLPGRHKRVPNPNAPKLWMQTGPLMMGGWFTFIYPAGQKPEGHGINHSFPQPGIQPPFPLKAKRGRPHHDEEGELGHWSEIGGMMILSPSAAEILSEYNLGKTQIFPFELLKSDGQPMSKRYALIMGETRSIIHSDWAGSASSGIAKKWVRDARDHEIDADASKIDNLDLCIQKVRRQSFLVFSGQLMEALVRAKMRPRMRLKRLFTG